VTTVVDAAAPWPTSATSSPPQRLSLRDRVLRDSPALRVVIAVAAVAVAFHHSLLSLIDSLGVDSPLAYLGLVPFVAVGLAVALGRPRRGELAVNDRYLDCILGIPLLAFPLLMLAVLPSRMQTLFWLWRIDLLLLPLFAAGVVVLLFGTRTLLKAKAGLLFLFIAWPAPFQYVLQRWLDPFTSMTVSVVGRLAVWFHLATPSGPSLNGGFVVSTPSGGHFTVLVASQCSGANSLLGYLLIAAALLLVVGGSKAHKLSWLVVGAAIVWTANVIRISLIFLSGDLWGERVAIDGFHPYIGLVTFALATGAAVWLLPRFGLTFGGGRRDPDLARRRMLDAIPTIGVAALVALAFVAPTAVLDARLSRVDPIASALGLPRLRPFTASTMNRDGFNGSVIDHYPWASQYFGSSADWTRYQFDGGSSKLLTQVPIITDVITTDDPQTFADFGVEACYAFHGYDVSDRRTVDLGTGVTGTMLTWKDPQVGIRWVALFWYWPVLENGKTRFQRIVLLYAADQAGAVTAPPVSTALRKQLGLAPDDELRGPGTASAGRDATRRQLLLGFGRRFVSESVAHASGPD
jgi:exosortase/archaeosortase family protein